MKWILIFVFFFLHHLTLQAKPLHSIANIKDTMKGVDGREFSFQKVKRKKGLLVVFVSQHCPYVEVWLERLLKIGQEAIKNEIGVLFVNSNNPKSFKENSFESMVHFSKSNKLPFPYVMDFQAKMARKLRARRTPEAFLFDAQDRLIYHGAIDDHADDPKKVTQHYLKKVLKALAKGLPIKKQTTAVIGCQIK